MVGFDGRTYAQAGVCACTFYLCMHACIYAYMCTRMRACMQIYACARAGHTVRDVVQTSTKKVSNEFVLVFRSVRTGFPWCRKLWLILRCNAPYIHALQRKLARTKARTRALFTFSELLPVLYRLVSIVRYTWPRSASLGCRFEGRWDMQNPS
jgi:hypothetical protein